MKAFSKLHPITKSAFFICAFVLTLAGANPLISAISLCSALLYIAVSTRRAFFASMRFAVIAVLVVALFNMLFAHYGTTVLFTVKDTEFTLQALLYGVHQGLVLSSVMLWFRVLSYCQNSAETAYLLRFSPHTALLFSMVLGFIPRFNTKLAEIRDAQAGLCATDDMTKKQRFNTALQNLSALITYSLESSIITADSMTAKGFNSRAVSPSRYKITARDVVLTIIILVCFVYLLYAKIAHRLVFIFEPETYFKTIDPVAICLTCVLLLLPSAAEIWEVLLWKRATLKM
ncbi:MAG: hypothetical protein IJ077_03125 [Eubacterium sp.]|nr:hypothetical protein [Eubacterium sp.]